jgi:hypothetical protein
MQSVNLPEEQYRARTTGVAVTEHDRATSVWVPSDKPRLRDFSRNVYSQDGEDGILEAVFARIGVQSRLCIEFGAWDGLHLSNSAVFWRNGWRAVLIESAADRYRSLLSNTAGYDCLCIHHTVTPSGEGALEPLLLRRGLEGPADLLVIDVDGDDYQIFAGLHDLRPRVVCCEYNPTIPPHLFLVGQQGDGLGASARALVALAREQGYVLVAMTAVNCIFVLREEAQAFEEFETRLEALFPAACLVSLITAYDGRYLLSSKPPYGMTTPHRGGLFLGTACGVQQTLLEWLANRLSMLWHRVLASVRWRLSGVWGRSR